MEFENTHHHNYILDDSELTKNEKKTFYVVLFTGLMMIVEIVAGYITGSMSLLADGWHMASHAGALGITLIAYKLAKSTKLTKKFTFGGGKFIPLGGYTSAILLAAVSGIMIFESVQRILNPISIKFNEAILVAVLGLIVNIISAFILSKDDHHHGDHTHDHNLKSAYFHVLADALTSIFAIVALLIGKFYGLIWLDPAMGIVGSFVILKWAFNLIKDSAWELLDGHAKAIKQADVISLLSEHNAEVKDFHVWRIAPKAHACSIILKCNDSRSTSYYREIIKTNFDIKHITVEVN